MLPKHIEQDNFEVHRSKTPPSQSPSELLSAFSASIWYQSREHAKTAFNSYAKIDCLRPYFDVEPYEVLKRVISSFDPFLPLKPYDVSNELYGPCMACFTLATVLLFQMKMSDHHVQEGTLLGAAIFTCLAYWLITSSLVYFTVLAGNSTLKFPQILSSVGYSLCSACLVLLICVLIHAESSDRLFLILWLFICGAAAVRMAFILWIFNPNPVWRIAGACLIVSLHLGFVIYLHFTYHAIILSIKGI